jgi:hypothetical protein
MKTRARQVATVFLLVCATAHCVLSIFFVNVSYLDLAQYAAGTAPLPFQRRMLLVPFVRWAQGAGWLHALAVRWVRHVPQSEPMTAAKMGCLLLGVIAVSAVGLLVMVRVPRLGIRTRWLPWALLLMVLYVSYGARYEQPLWYPYDLPHLALFGAATVFLLTDEPWFFLACFCVDAFVRETSVFLLLVVAAVHWRQRRWQVAGLVGFLVWDWGQILARHLYPDNPTVLNAVPWTHMIAPWHWPQMFSVVGFLWVPVWMARRWLSVVQRRAMYAASVCMAATFFFATWNETRAWSEWSVLFAVLAAVCLERGLSAKAAPTAASGLAR